MALLASTSGSKTNNVAWFSPGITLPAGGPDHAQITLSFSSASALTNAQLSVTFDGGTSWQTVGTGVVPAAGGAYEVTFNITKNQTFNVRQSTAGAVTITYANVFLTG